MSIVDLWKTALPQSRAFSLIINKTMRKFYEGLDYPQYYRDLFDKTYKEIDPQSTESLERWEDQFYLPSSGLTEQDRRDRLEATWKKTGGQSPAYLQGILRGYGFDVYVHDWWMPLTPGGSPTPWDPNTVLTPPYYPLVNRIATTNYNTINMGSENAYMGSANAYMGALVTVENADVYPVPSDPEKWRGFCYIAAETMPNAATVPLDRKKEFEELILAIFPAHLWCGIIVNFT